MKDLFFDIYKSEKSSQHNTKENKDKEIITTIKIKHNTSYKSRKEAEDKLKEYLRLDGYRVLD